MHSEISNTASLTFNYGAQVGSAVSNTANIVLRETVSISKSSIENSYYLGDSITYVISVSNNSNSEISNLKITDNLGSYTLEGSDKVITPLDYIAPAHLYVNGIFVSEIIVQANANDVVFNVASIPGNSVANIIYKVLVNNKAMLEKGAKITSSATVNLNSVAEPVAAFDTLSVAEIADVQVVKSMCPQSVARGEEITYKFSLYNYGNVEATNVVLTDVFSPIPSVVKTSVGTQELSFGDYSLVNGKFTLPAYSSDFSISIPAADFRKNYIDGTTIITPGRVDVSLIGKI